MTIKQSPNFTQVKCTVDNLLAGLCRPVFTLETQECRYQANSLTEVMHLYRDAKDDSEVLDLNRLG
jgi:hypothetical protein